MFQSNSNRSFRIAAAVLGGLFILGTQTASAIIAVPELIYYKFNEGSGTTTQNYASSPVGNNPASIVGQTLDSPGVFSSTALNGTGASNDHVTTGWSTNLGSSSWTVAWWRSRVDTAGQSSALSYEMGDQSVSSFRVFNNGVAGTNGLILRGGGITDVLIGGLSNTDPDHVAFVYDAPNNVIRGYLNGSPVTSVAQPALNIVGSGNTFFVGGYSSNTLASVNWMDEFQLYSRALDDNGVVDAMNANFSAVPEPTTLGLLGAGAVIVLRRARRV